MRSDLYSSMAKASRTRRDRSPPALRLPAISSGIYTVRFICSCSSTAGVIPGISLPLSHSDTILWQFHLGEFSEGARKGGFVRRRFSPLPPAASPRRWCSCSWLRKRCSRSGAGHGTAFSRSPRPPRFAGSGPACEVSTGARLPVVKIGFCSSYASPASIRCSAVALWGRAAPRM